MRAASGRCIVCVGGGDRVYVFLFVQITSASAFAQSAINRVIAAIAADSVSVCSFRSRKRPADNAIVVEVRRD